MSCLLNKSWMTERNILHKSFHSFFSLLPAVGSIIYVFNFSFGVGNMVNMHFPCGYFCLLHCLLAIKTLYAFENFLARSF